MRYYWKPNKLISKPNNNILVVFLVLEFPFSKALCFSVLFIFIFLPLPIFFLQTNTDSLLLLPCVVDHPLPPSSPPVTGHLSVAFAFTFSSTSHPVTGHLRVAFSSSRRSPLPPVAGYLPIVSLPNVRSRRCRFQTPSPKPAVAASSSPVLPFLQR